MYKMYVCLSLFSLKSFKLLKSYIKLRKHGPYFRLCVINTQNIAYFIAALFGLWALFYTNMHKIC